jgi:hypothetical protein
MKLERHVDDLEGLDEAVRALYVEDEEEGGYSLDVEIDGLEDPEPLRANNRKLLKQLDQIRKKNKDIEPHYTELLEAQQKADEDAAKKKGDYESLIRQKDEKHQAELKKHIDEAETLKTEIVSHLVDKTATEAIAKAKGSVTVLLPHVKGACRCAKDDDGRWKVEVLGPDGRPRLNSKGEAPMTIAEFVEELKSKDEFAVNFEGSGATGGGATESQGRGGAAVVLRGEDRSDPDKYRRAKEEADKKGVELVMAD